MLPIYVINLPDCIERWEKMVQRFPKDQLIKVMGFDGRIWENPDIVDEQGRPTWKPGVRRWLENRGVLGAHPIHGTQGKSPLWKVLPGEVGCSLAHIAVWNKICAQEQPWAIVLEDDCMPTDKLGTRSLAKVVGEELKKAPKDLQVGMLFASTPDEDCLTLDSDGQVVGGWNTVGYVISLFAAKHAISVTLPVYEPIDRQWWKLAFARNQMPCKIPIKSRHKIGAYGIGPYIVPSEMNEKSYIGPLWKRHNP